MDPAPRVPPAVPARTAVVATVLLTLLTLPPLVGVAVGQSPPAPPSPQFTFAISGGLQAFDYKETFEGGESDYSSIGPAWNVTAGLRLAERWRITLDYVGSAIGTETETWNNIGTVAGQIVDQENDLEVTFHVLDLDLGYSLVKTPQVEWVVAAGWHFYAQDFERSQFKFLVANIVFPITIRPVSEDVRGQGVKLGTTLDWRLSERFVGTGGLAVYYLYLVDVENSELGELDSEGWAVRWRIGLDYALTPTITLGGSYHGHYIGVEEATTATAILPENRTLAHTFLLGLGLRF